MTAEQRRGEGETRGERGRAENRREERRGEKKRRKEKEEERRGEKQKEKESRKEGKRREEKGREGKRREEKGREGKRREENGREEQRKTSRLQLRDFGGGLTRKIAGHNFNWQVLEGNLVRKDCFLNFTSCKSCAKGVLAK